MSRLILKEISSIIDEYDVFLFDLWGVIVNDYLITHTLASRLEQLIKIKKVFFITNSPKLRNVVTNKINYYGMNIAKDIVFTAGDISKQIINQSKLRFNITNPLIYHLGSKDDLEILEGVNCKLTSNINNANILLLTVYKDQGEDLCEFDNLLKFAASSNIINICANPDIIVPNFNTARYCAGFFAKKIENFGGKVIYAGKPNKEIFQQVLNKVKNIPKKRILMIGDTLITDILGANLIGIDSALVLTGNTKSLYKDNINIEKKLALLTKITNQMQIKPSFIVKID